MTLFLFIVGLASLIFGAELFLKAVDHFGLKWGVSPLIMGLTVVAFATGAPELAISIKAAASGSADLVLGNIIGSNIANILLILGITSLISLLHIAKRVILIDLPIVVAVSLTLFLLAKDGTLTKMDGGVLIMGLIGYSIFTYYRIQKSKNGDPVFAYEKKAEELASGTWFYIKNGGMLILGLALIVQGSNWMVDSAVTIATLLGISELVIGLTIVSIGTSLPEVATSVAAARKGNADIAVANVLGSNLYNMLLTLGLTLLISPHVLQVSAVAIHFDLPFMIIVTLICIPLFLGGYNLTRTDGSIFLFYYASYITFLVLDALSAPFKEYMAMAMYWVVSPITILYIVWQLVAYRQTLQKQ